MNIGKKKAMACVLAFLMIWMTACGSIGSTPEVSGNTGDTYVIGVSFPTTKLIYRQAMKDVLLSRYPDGRGDGCEIVIYDAEGSQEQQNQDILDMVDKGYDGIILIPLTMEGLISAIQYANGRGVPVITVDNMIEEQSAAEVISYVGADHYRMGKIAAQLFLTVLEERYTEEESWNVIELSGIPGASGTVDRGVAIGDVLGNRSRVHLLGSFNAQFTRENAKSVMEDCIQIYPDIHGVICQNDLMALGCYDALEEAGLLDQVVVVGIDGQKEVVEKMVNGGIHGTVIQYPEMIQEGVEILIRYLNGEEIENCYYTEVNEITADTAEDYLVQGLPW